MKFLWHQQPPTESEKEITVSTVTVDRFTEHREYRLQKVEGIHFCTSVISTHENIEYSLNLLGLLPSEN